MELPGGRDARFNPYGMSLLSGETPPDIYGNPPSLGRPSTSLQQLSPRHTMVASACGGGGGGGGRPIKSDVCYDERGMTPQMGMDACGVNDIGDDAYTGMQVKKSPPSNGKKTKGRVKIKMEYIENKLRRYTTFSKRKTGIMKKAYELSTLTGTQVMLLVASETGHVYTFATRKLQPMITSDAGKALIQTCLNSPDPPAGGAGGSVDQRMSATGFEETELTYNISDEDSKDENMSTVDSSADSGSDCDQPLQDDQEFRIPTTTSPIITQPTKNASISLTSSSSSSNHTRTAATVQSPLRTTTQSTTSNANATASSQCTNSISAKTSSSMSAGSSTVSAAAAASTSGSGSGGTGSALANKSKTSATNRNHNTNSNSSSSSSSSSHVTATPIIPPPLLYTTPQGVMYATPASNGGMIFSLTPPTGDPTLGQFITIPLSAVMSASGQGELDLSKRK